LQPGDLAPAVWCRYTEWPDEAGVTGDWALFDAPGGVYSSGFGYDEMRTECRFYNVPKPDDPVAQEDAYNYLDLYKFYCQVPIAPPAGAEVTWYEDNCDPVAQWDFQMEWTGGESIETTGADGRASWTGLPTGTWTATEFLPDFYETPVVWCRYTEWPDEAGVTGDWAQFEAPGGVYANGFGYDQMRMECRYYNIYVAGEEDYNYLDLYKFYCQVPALPPPNAELTWYEDNCDPVPLWDFQLEWVGGERTETTDQTGRARWTGLPAGTWTATEFLPDFYETPVVWCRYTEWPEEAGILDQWARFEAPGGVYSNGFGYEQMGMECRYYNIFLAEDNTVTVYKWDCLPGTEYGRTLPYYQGEDQDEGPCETEHLGVPMSLIDANGTDPRPTQANGTQWDGIALQNGSFQITEQIPTGYGDPMVFCGTLDDDGQSPMPATGGSITLTPATEPFAYQCNWYNITFDVEYQLELYKFLCAPDVDPSLGLPDLGTICAPIEGVSFTATFGANPPSARYTNQFGRITWTEAQMGDWSLQEAAMPGWGPPKVYCGPPQTTETPEVAVTNLAVSGTLDPTTPHIVCVWFNFEREVENGRITIYKYQCPPGITSDDFATLREDCTVPFNGVNFTLQSGAAVSSAATVGGAVDWIDLDDGPYLVREQLLPGYGEPLVWCGYVRQDGVDIDPAASQFTGYPVTDGAIALQLSNLPARIVCYWYNVSTAPGEITINKWLCPPGYDMTAWGADPMQDCTIRQDGITFTLDRPGNADVTATTGDGQSGAVRFSGLDPGAYSITEAVPSDIADVFVLDCTGTNIPKVHQRPLSWGNRLDVNLAAADAIVCNWYDVPYPDDGWVTVYKYQCWTTTFTSAVDCEIYELGASFGLVSVPGGTAYGTGTTNAAGHYTWGNLDAGSYRLDELSAQPCKATSTKVDATGNIRVDAGEATIVKVYNCSPPSPPTTPGAPPVAKPPPGKVPGKYPNTGVAPHLSNSPKPAAQGTSEGTPEATQQADVYYRISCLEEPPDVAATPIAPENGGPPAATATPVEFDLALTVEATEETATPTAGTPTGRVTIISRPDGTPVVGTSDPDEPQVPEDCVRGALPARVVIEAANVDAGVETLEIIDGVMQQPTGPTDVAWYKETGRLGEPNNVVIAGHLNWWNVPEGVFFRLQDLQEGDRVEITGDDGRVYVYEVQWVRQESNLEPPAAEVIGPTDEPSLTLITCGGEWNADISEYDERTVARAVQVDVIAADDADDSAASSP
jgi:sortase (surface protein transpeptidase)